jgi:hypothetical protein
LVPAEFARVGDEVRVAGYIETSGGAYQVWFGDKIVVSDTAIGYSVATNFTVPYVSGGEYVITLKDVSRNVNATMPFNILEAYYINALVPSSPAQLQEGSSVVLNVTLTGAQPSTVYYANITVKLPDPLNTNYSRIVELTSLTRPGIMHAEITYPDSALFQPSGSNTAFMGLYNVYFNLTTNAAENEFFIGLTDASQYHRGQTVSINAAGYQPSQVSEINITHAETGDSVHSETVTATSEGTINAVWAVPNNALIGDYNITITPQGTSKSIVDSQLFTVPGYPVKIRTLNLAGEPAPQILVEALDQATNTLYNGTSGDNGIVTVNLEKGNHALDAFWNGVRVGNISVSITGEDTYDLACKLTNLKITVQDKNGVLIPFVSLDIIYQYVTTKEGLSKTGQSSGQTDLSGAFTFNSTLPGIGYTINASIYGMVFNITTVSDTPALPTFHVTLLCPSRTLTLKIRDYNLAVIPNARIELVEQTSGIFHGAVTDNSGAVSVEVTFGKYRLRIYTDNILLNETVIEAFSDAQSEIRCILYNLQLSVVVVDYFDQPIPNVNVILHGSTDTRSDTTKADGTATFGNLIGGDIQIIAYLTGREDSYEAMNLQVEAPTAIKIKMGKYILLGSFLIETSLLATLIIILAVVILFLSMEVYRRTRFKWGKK